MRNPRENFILSGAVCIVFGAFFTVAEIYLLAGTIGISGVALFIIGMSIKSDLGLSKKEIREWLPSSEGMPDAGRVMYRVDTTIDKPITTSILCGACAHIEVVKGKRPQTYTCVSCERFLWLDEEE
ncbi:MAG TPA: hypothetical protein EYQ58_02045 [Candidatus Poseidoniales archaeon]|nr:MAG: hypothetical protein CXT70_03380 [Euryarchaeota archaeon]HIF90319.1 hypothetical protein [Candidatus Poseidoniales archaeon]